MTLSRKTPLPSHTFPDEGKLRCCLDCGTTWDTTEYDDPPPWPCKRSSLDRGSGPAPVSETNSGRAHQRDEGLREYVRRLPCVVCGSPPPNSACHVKNWGAGYGDWVVTPDGERVGNLYPGCVEHHREEENALNSGPETFEKRHDIDLAAEARRVGEAYVGS